MGVAAQWMLCTWWYRGHCSLSFFLSFLTRRLAPLCEEENDCQSRPLTFLGSTTLRAIAEKNAVAVCCNGGSY